MPCGGISIPRTSEPIFSDPRLARIYDAFDADRDDLTPYLAIGPRRS
jgi:hypothetical protein